MKENVKESLMIILKGYKENKFNEEEVLTLIDTIIDNNGTNTITYPLSTPGIPWQNPQPLSPTWTNPPYTVTCSEAVKTNISTTMHNTNLRED